MAYLTRWQPFGTPSLARDWNRFWSPLLTTSTAEDFCVPAVDVVKHGDDMVVRAELPGMQADDIDLEVEGDLLTIKADRRSEESQEGEDYLVREIDYGHFERTLRIPSEVSAEDVKADFHDGILEVTLPHAAIQEPRAHRIQVRSS